LLKKLSGGTDSVLACTSEFDGNMVVVIGNFPEPIELTPYELLWLQPDYCWFLERFLMFCFAANL